MKYCYTNESLRKQFRATWKMLMVISILLNSLVFKMSAQGTTVTGTVVDEKNQPLTGVNVIVKGKTNGTITDLDGKFSINAASSDILSFTFVGYKSEEIAVGTQTQIKVTLKEEVTLLNEVVVVGYGVQKKSDLTGAIASVTSDDIKNMPVLRIDDALQGKAAGVEIIQNSGQPGADPKIRVRGYATINGGNPLIVIDGVSGGSLKDINPGDIESMEILKDAASQAIYGSAGGNGVILITTKHGKEGKFKVNFDMFCGVQSPWSTDNVKVANAQQYAAIYDQTPTHAGYFYYNPATKSYMDHIDSTKALTNTNWIDQIFNTSMVQNYNLNISTAGKKTSLFSSIGYSDEDGTLLRTYNKKYTFRLNSEYQIIKMIKIGENLNLSDNISSNQGEFNEYGSPLSTAIQMLPIVPVFASDGSGHYAYQADNLASNIQNPMDQIYRNNNINTYKEIFGNVHIKLDIIKGLSFESKFGFYSNTNLYKQYTPVDSVGAWGSIGSSQSNFIPQYQRNTNDWNGWQWQNYFTYNLTLADKHTFNVVAGYESMFNTNTFVNKTASNIIMKGNWEDYTNTTGMIAVAPQQTIEWSEYRYFGRLNYNFADIVLLEGTISDDNNSKFGPNKREGTFPAASAGIKFSEIEYIKDLNFIDFGKIRIGYGETGNSDIPAFSYNSTVGVLPSFGYPFGGVTSQPGAALLTAGNPDLHWETVITKNIGIDLGFLKNRLSFSFDYFIRNNQDMLLRKSVPYYVGFVVTGATQELGNPSLDTRPLVNYGTLDNRGFEINLGYKDKIGDFEYDINANVSHLTTTMTNIGDPLLEGNGRGVSGVCRTEDGQPVSEFYGYQISGIYKESDFTWYLNNSPGNGGKWARVVAESSRNSYCSGLRYKW